MKRLGILLTGLAMTIAAPATAQSAKGDWAGVLEGTNLRLVVHIAEGTDGVLTGSIDSPDQGSYGMPLADIRVAGTSLTFAVPLVASSYEGTWDAAARAWKGEWRQGQARLPIVLAAAPPPAPLPADWQVPGDAAIAQLIDARIAPRRGAGIVAGVLEPGGGRIVARGPAGAPPFDGRTLFEIGSISKVFTALLLSDMVAKGEVSLDDPADKYLPGGARMPERGGRKITLKDLAMHQSGLPRLPDNMAMANPNDPYADYTEEQMLEFLGRYQLPRDIGARYEYSNLGMGLLGYLLGRAAGVDYETLLQRRITGPLGMADTVIAVAPEQRQRLAQGYDSFMRPTGTWHLPVLAGAGGIRSTTEDMLKFAAAVLDPGSPIAPAMKVALAERRATDDPRFDAALGWIVSKLGPKREALFHNGGTGGHRSALMIEPARRVAVVALTNAAVEPATTDLTVHLLAGSPVAPTPPVPPAPPPPVTRAEVKLPPAELDRVVGRYEFMPGVALTVERNGDGLVAQMTGQPAVPIYAEAPLSFFWRVADAQVRFTADASGKVTGAVLSQAGQQLTGKRASP